MARKRQLPAGLTEEALEALTAIRGHRPDLVLVFKRHRLEELLTVALR